MADDVGTIIILCWLILLWLSSPVFLLASKLMYCKHISFDNTATLFAHEG